MAGRADGNTMPTWWLRKLVRQAKGLIRDISRPSNSQTMKLQIRKRPLLPKHAFGNRAGSNRPQLQRRQYACRLDYDGGVPCLEQGENWCGAVMLPTFSSRRPDTLPRCHARSPPLHPLGRRTHAVPDAEVVASTAGPGHEGPGPHRMQAYPHQGYAPFSLVGQLIW